MARFSERRHLKKYMANSIIMAHLSSLMSMLKVKLDWNSPENFWL
jgi:hypothetical protein